VVLLLRTLWTKNVDYLTR